VADIEKREVAAGRLRITVGQNGLPAQIDIQAAPADLPLEHRGKDAPAPSAETLAAIGRGPQFAAPMFLEAIVDGKELELAVTTPAPLEQKGDSFLCRATLAGAGLQAKVDASYDSDGAMHFKVTYSGGAADALSLAMKLPGPVDTVVAGAAPFMASDYSLPEGEGLLWGNAAPPLPQTQQTAPPEKPADASPSPPTTGAEPAELKGADSPSAETRRAKRVESAPTPPINRGAPGVPPHLFWGSGDRGFTWLSDSADGWTVTPVAAAVTLSRDKAGVVTWRARLVNHPTEIRAAKTVAFTLLTHPATLPGADRRKVAWLTWPYGAEALTPPLQVTSLSGKPRPVRADIATPYETQAAAILLQGPAGGDARSAADTQADTYPLALFRYLAGTHAGLPARLRANSPGLTRPGRNPAPDRVAIGRALLHDIGFDPAGAAHLAMLGRTVGALAHFGLFEPDGKTEFIPYWRSGSVLRYGEPFSKDDAFEETTTDPMARVHVSAWLRPSPSGKARKALILVVNEGDKPVRGQLYVLSAQRLFGGANRFTKIDMVDRWDMSAVPEDSDWSQKKLRGEPTGTTTLGVAPRAANVPFLLDLEDGGGVAQSVAVNGQEVYHRLFIPARGFRLLLGGAP
jgi:hypothetical protein